MTNKKFRVGVLTMVLVFGMGATSAFAESNIQNWISGEISVLGAGVRYERMLNERFSVGVIAFTTLFVNYTAGAQVFGRFYPWASNFYAEVGLGGGTASGGLVGSGNRVSGIMITPGIGWRVDVGEPGRFFLNPNISMPVILGTGTAFEFRPAFGMGFAF